MKNCKNCGAPLHNGKCDYCGTEYYSSLTDTNFPPLKIDTYTHPVDTLACKVAIPIEMQQYMTESELKELAIKDICWDLIDKLKDYVELESWTDIYTCHMMVGGRIKIARPN